MENFYQRCGVDDIMPIPQSCNLNTMSKDLDVLKKDVVPPKIPTLLLSSMDDPIVPNIVIHEHKNEYYHIFFEHIEGAQHAMGLKKTEQIFQKVMSFLHTHQIL